MSIKERLRGAVRGYKASGSATSVKAGAAGFPTTTTVVDGAYQYRFICHSQKEKNRAERLLDKEKGTIAWLARELKPDDVFYDIGANIGVYTIFAAHRIGAQGGVVSFEPHIPNAASLIQNIFLNGQQSKVQLVSAALTNSPSYRPFNYQSLEAASSTSQYGGNSYEGDVFSPVFVEIKHGCAIDGLIAAGVIRKPNLVKIDVDGLDYEVLEGMRDLLASPEGPRSIQVELGSDSKPKIVKLCEEVGYVLKEKHWTQAGLDFIAQGRDGEDYPHYGIYYHPKHA